MVSAPDNSLGRATEVAPGVFAYVQPDGGWALNNAGFVTDGGETIVIDTAATERRARNLRTAIHAVEASEPRFLVNTHHHSDHTFGNFVFHPATAVVSTAATRHQIGANGLHFTRLFPEVEWGDVQVRQPNIVFDASLVLHAGNHAAELIEIGPAHTLSDVVAWLPEHRVLFTGDLAMNGVTPFAMMGSVKGSIAALERLAALRPAVVVPGHGNVGGPEILSANIAYFRWILELAAAGHGRPPVDVAKAAGFGDFGHLLDRERLVANLRRAAVDLDPQQTPGAPVDILAVFTEMVDFAGGRIASQA